VTKEEVDAVIDKYEKICEDAFKKAAEETQTFHKHWLDSPWSGFFEGKDPLHVSDTGMRDTAFHLLLLRFRSGTGCTGTALDQVLYLELVYGRVVDPD
jgi:hypothetical protein